MDYTYFVDEDGVLKRLHAEMDPVPWNPRLDDDANIGTMFCLHRRYNLGDALPIKTALDMKYAMIEDAGMTPKQIVNAVRNFEAYLHFYLDYDRHQRKWEIIRTPATVVAREHSLEFLEEEIIDELTVQEIVSLTKGRLVALPLFLYDHSGLAMSTGSFVGKAVHAEWNSGQVGWIWTTAKKAENISGIKKPSCDWLQKALESEVKTYSQYLEGDVYGYIVEKYEDGEWVETDSCWGYYVDGIDPLSELSDEVFGTGQWSYEEPSLADSIPAA